MKKLTVVVPRQDADALLRQLMRLRAVSLEPIDKAELPLDMLDGIDLAGARANLARIETAARELARYSKRKKSIFGHRSPVSPAAFRGDGREAAAWKVVEETCRIIEQRQELKSAFEAEELRKASFRPYLSLREPLGYNGTASSAFLLGALPSGLRIERAEQALEGLAAVPELLFADATGTYITVLAHKSEEKAVLSALASIGWSRALFRGENKNAAQLTEDAKIEQTKIRGKLGKLEARLAALSDKLCDVEILWDIENTTLLAEENKQRLAATRECAVLEGFCPADDADRVTRLLERHGAAYELLDPTEEDDPPILLKNNGFARNFEWVLGMYSYPKYGRFDPTFIMSIFYFLIFGLMFADAGYGLVLMLGCFGAVRWLRPREGMKRFLLMFGYCGISCLLFGVLFGSYFGNFPLAFLENVLKVPVNEMPNLSKIASTQANLAILFDPLQNPMAFLVVSLAFGALHLLAGMAVRAYILCRDGKVLDALLDTLPYWTLFAGLGLLVINSTLGAALSIAGVLLILVTQGRHKKGFAQKLLGGLGGLYGLINYASDLLSYSRVLALGLASAVIGQVINILATLKGASVIGFLLMILVFVIGHLLNIVINVLGTFVHTARLQYIEFFGKFYEDGGRPFRPMTASDRYIEDCSSEEDELLSTQLT